MVTKILKTSERYRRLFNILQSGAKVCGANVIPEDYRMTWITWFLIALINSYYLFTTYTIYEGVVIRNDFTVILQSLCLAGTAVQGYVKLLSAISNASNLRFLHAESDGLYETFERKHEQYQNHLETSMSLMKRIVILLVLIYAITPLGLISIPLYYSLILKQQKFVMQFIIPGIDPTSEWGYVIHQITQVSCILFGSFGNFASDTLLFVCVSQIPLLKNILKCKFDDLDEVLQKYPEDTTRRRDMLKDILQWHQKYNNVFLDIHLSSPTMVTKVLKTSERYRRLFNILLSGAKVCGANVIPEDYRMSWITWFLIALINSYYLFTIYTIYEGVVIRNDFTVILQSLCLAGTAVQGYVKLLNAISNAPKLRFLHAESDDLYETFERKHEQYQNHLETSMSLLKRVVVLLVLIYSITPLGLISIPLYYSLVLKQQKFVMQFIIPGIDPTSEWGYVIHQITQVSCILFGSFGNFASDTLLFMSVSQIPLLKNILKCKFDDLDEALQKYPEDTTRRRDMLKDIFQWHQKYNNFSNVARNSFFWVIAVQIGTATNSIICTIVCLFLGVWPAGYIYLVYSFLILYIFCGLGNLVEIANDDVTTIIYGCDWYKLSVSEQKMLIMMLRNSQKAEGMTIGGVSPLSMNTALQLTKTIYTMAMMLNEFLN